MTEDKKISNNFARIDKYCCEIKEHLEGDCPELPKGRYEQLKEDIAAIRIEIEKNPDLEEKILEFESLCKKYMNKLHSMYETRDLARWEHYTLKVDLCKKVEKLSKCQDSDLPRVARELKLTRLRWKDIGSVPHEKSEEVWNDFCNQCDKLQNRITEYYNNLEEKRNKIAVEKIKICEEAEKIKLSIDWEDTANEFKKLQKRWRDIGFTAPDKEKELYIRFRAACDVFFNARKEYYRKARLERDNVSTVKSQLCEEAKTIFDLSYSDAHQLIPDLWKRWKAAGSAGRNDRELYEEFRGYFDAYYEKLRKQRDENLKIKKKLCEKLEIIEKDLDSGVKFFSDINEEYLNIKKQWDSTGAMPRAKEEPVIGKYSLLCGKVDAFKTKSTHVSKKFLERIFETEKIVSEALEYLDSQKMEKWEQCRKQWQAATDAEKKYFKENFQAIEEAFEKDSAEYYEKLVDSFKDNLKSRRKICKELESLGLFPEEDATDEDLAQELTQAIAKNFATGNSQYTKNDCLDHKAEKIGKLTERWLKAGAVPAKNLDKLYERFEQAVEAAKNSE